VKIGSGAIAVVLLAGLLAGANARAEETAQRLPQETPSHPPGTSAQSAQEVTKPPDPNAPPNAPVATAPQAQADNPDICEVPSYLLATESPLQRVEDAVKTRQRLNILVVGSASSILAGPDGATTSYPARLEAALRNKLNGITVQVTTVPQPKKTAADVANGLANLAKDHKPDLVVWQTGTVDALKSVDPDDFRTAIDDGIAALQTGGVDVLLMNLQYTPRMETMISVAPYLDNMRVSAQEHNVPLFDRFSMMRHWNENGRFDLFNTSHGFALAKRVHDCLGQVLAKFVIDAAHLDAAELRTQR
jgi:hypothetical protein